MCQVVINNAAVKLDGGICPRRPGSRIGTRLPLSKRYKVPVPPPRHQSLGRKKGGRESHPSSRLPRLLNARSAAARKPCSNEASGMATPIIRGIVCNDCMPFSPPPTNPPVPFTPPPPPPPYPSPPSPLPPTTPSLLTAVNTVLVTYALLGDPESEISVLFTK